MKTVLSFVALTLTLLTSTAAPLGTAFTYQGRLMTGGIPAKGLYDFAFNLYDTATGPALVGPTLTLPSVAVSNGSFTVTLDFGGAFDGSARWLGIYVKTNLAADYTELPPRQLLSPIPYALMSAGLTPSAAGAPLHFTNAANTYAGNGSGLSSLNPTNLGPGLIPDANLPGNLARTNQVWLLNGNRGTTPGTQYLGTMDSAALELKVNNTRGLRLEVAANSPNVIAGSSNNVIANGVIGASILGGHGHSIGIISPNSVIGGGLSNIIESYTGQSTIGGGWGNTIQNGSTFAAIGGGYGNTVGTNAYSANIAGGYNNLIQYRAERSFIGGGYGNTIEENAFYSTIAGGSLNLIQTNSWQSTISGGLNNAIQTNAYGSAIGGGDNNVIQSDAHQSSIGGGTHNLIQTNADYSVIGGGYYNTIQTNATRSIIVGGYQNMIQTNAGYSFIGGGYQNRIFVDANNSTIVGGRYNSIQSNAFYSKIGGGYQNTIQSNASYSVIGGGNNNTIFIDATQSTIGGGAYNRIHTNADYSTIGGGNVNVIQDNCQYSTIPGGNYNFIQYNSDRSTIGGGTYNTVQSNASMSTIAGGSSNTIKTNADYATISGGSNNTNGAPYAMIPGGDLNYAIGRNSFAAGHRAKALHDGAFVWADNSGGDISSTANNQFLIRASGGATFTSGIIAANQTVAWTPGSASWSFTSDRNTKTNIQPANPQEILDKLSKLPISQWNYIGYSQQHVGPMAQDFHALFPYNESETTLNDADLHGVALAAIKGLNQKLEEKLQSKDAQIQSLQQQIAELKTLLEKISHEKTP